MRPWRVMCIDHVSKPVEGCDHCRTAFALDTGLLGAELVTDAGRVAVGRILVGPAGVPNVELGQDGSVRINARR